MTDHDRIQERIRKTLRQCDEWYHGRFIDTSPAKAGDYAREMLSRYARALQACIDGHEDVRVEAILSGEWTASHEELSDMVDKTFSESEEPQ